MMEYQVAVTIGDESPIAIGETVNKLIRQGWTPQGGVSLNITGKTTVYAQAMVRLRQPGEIALDMKENLKSLDEDELEELGSRSM